MSTSVDDFEKIM